MDKVLKEQKIVDDNAELQFIISPNDLVYVPTDIEMRTGTYSYDAINIYKIVSFTGNRLYAVPYSTAKTIVDKVEYSQLNKVEFTDNKVSIKEICVPIKVDRLGEIIEFNGNKV